MLAAMLAAKNRWIIKIQKGSDNMQAKSKLILAGKPKKLAVFRLAKARKTAKIKGILELMMGVEPITSSLPTPDGAFPVFMQLFLFGVVIRFFRHYSFVALGVLECLFATLVAEW